ncbi:MAG TPA: VOC family protein [Thermoleophilia bacterium]|nr:VOC family protein [Thermoleophilia bacterium]
MPRYIHFEHFVDEPEKALEFYKNLFGWTGEKFGEFPYWLITSGPADQPGINGGIGGPPAPGGQRVVNTVGVDDIDSTIAKAEEAGATVVREKMPIPGMAWFAYLADPTGVVFGVYQEDKSAG